MALDFTCFTTRQAKSIAASSSCVGLRSVTTLSFEIGLGRSVAALHEHAAGDASG